jgi:hypothetical protein
MASPVISGIGMGSDQHEWKTRGTLTISPKYWQFNL